MSANTLLTTADAEALYRFPARTFADWCREDKIDGARKAGREWLMPKESIDAFLAANPQLAPSDRSVTTRVPRWLWQALVVIALLLGLLADVYAVRDIISGGDRTLLWVVVALLSAGLWVSALSILTAKRRRGIVGWKGEQPVYRETRRYTSRLVRWSSGIAVVAMPALLILGIVGYNVWRVIPPRQTVVLVADFNTPDGRDPSDVTERLVQGMQDTLAGHPNIIVKRLKQAISEEQGTEEARSIGNRPEHKAAFVIWGDYVLEPEPELYVHFDILRKAETFLGAGTYEQYSPAQIQQPSMFDFKLALGPYLGQLTAFASAMALSDAGNYKEAIPLFDTAAQAVGQRLAAQWERAIRFYRGTNLLALDRALDAKPDLVALVPDQDTLSQVFDEFTVAALGNLGMVALQQGDYAAAKEYHEQSLALYQQLGNPLGEAHQLGNLGVVAQHQGDYAAAKDYHEQALALHRQLGTPLGAATDLSNLGVVAQYQGDYAAAKDYLGQSLALHRQLRNPLGEAHQLGNLGVVAKYQGDYAAAKDYLEQALALYRQLGNLLGETQQLGNLGLVAQQQGDYATAREYHEQSLALYRQLGNPLGEADQRGSLGLTERQQGNYAATQDYLEQALALHRQLGTPLGEATDLGNIGVVAHYQGDYTAARDYLELSLALFRQLGNLLGEADQLGNLGVVAQEQGDYAAAKEYHEQSLALHRQLGNPPGEAANQGNLGVVAQLQGDYAAAKVYHEQALALYRQLGNPLGEAEQLGNLGAMTAQHGDYTAAKNLLEEALILYRQLGDPLGEARQLGNLGVVAQDQGDYAAAKNYLERSARIYQQLGLPIHPAVQSALDQLSAP